MSKKPLLVLSWGDVRKAVAKVASGINNMVPKGETIAVYPVPRGGIPCAIMIQEEFSKIKRTSVIVKRPEDADMILDDLLDSGATRLRFMSAHPGTPFVTLFSKQGTDYQGRWVVFPWEEILNETGPTDAVTRLIEYIGDDPTREGLRETPQRVIDSYAELFGGYHKDPAEEMKTFEDDSSDEMILLKDVEFYSTCEHHMQPFFGKAHIAYIPEGKVLGVSKLARIVEVYSRRLSIQERICQQVTAAIDKHLAPQGSACILEAKHFCMCARGVGKQNSIMKTSSLTGVFKEYPVVRKELFDLIRD